MSAFIIEVSADARTLHRTEALLREHGYSVGIASSFVEGLALLDSVMADLLVADLRLNDYNGLELATQIHLDHPDVAVIITAASDDWWAEGEAKRHGAAFIAAPLENPAFLSCVRAVLDRRRPPMKSTRRWFRTPVADEVPVHAANARAQIVDISDGGLRLVFSGPCVIPATQAATWRRHRAGTLCVDAIDGR